MEQQREPGNEILWGTAITSGSARGTVTVAWVQAVFMARVGQHLDDAAVTDVAMCTFRHADQFGLKRSKPRQARPHARKVSPRDLVCPLAWRIRWCVGQT